ncbi:MAG: 50S ribosomal protein L18 [Candidatus Pacearchaeota archaeon]
MRRSKRTIRRRRMENKTDYKLRKKILESKFPRIVIRKTNKYFIVQVVESSEAQDRVIKTITSKKLLEYGWDKKMTGSLKSIPAGYLTGLVAAKEIGKGNFTVDLGMYRTLTGCRVFSVVKGLIDGGLGISANEKVFPSEDRINGEHLKAEMKELISKVKSKIK